MQLRYKHDRRDSAKSATVCSFSGNDPIAQSGAENALQEHNHVAADLD